MSFERFGNCFWHIWRDVLLLYRVTLYSPVFAQVKEHQEKERPMKAVLAKAHERMTELTKENEKLHEDLGASRVRVDSLSTPALSRSL